MHNAVEATAADAPPMNPVPPELPGRVLHIDGDILAYWAGGKEDTSVGVSRTIALNKIAQMQEYSGAERVVVHLTAASSTKGDRFIIATVKPYQGQRKSGSKPKNWAYLREWLETYSGPAFRVKTWATREADDGLAAMAYHSKGNLVIATKDKDMRMLPGWHLDWDTLAMVHVPVGTYDLVHDGKQYGIKWFWLQMLQGDTADNIPGLPMYNGKPVGPKTAENMLHLAEDRYTAQGRVELAYQQYYGDGWVDALVEQALLLWLRNDPHASIYNVLEVVGTANMYYRALHEISKRIQGVYDEANRITSQVPS
jgi:DNA polymerase-1